MSGSNRCLGKPSDSAFGVSAFGVSALGSADSGGSEAKDGPYRITGCINDVGVRSCTGSSAEACIVGGGREAIASAVN